MPRDDLPSLTALRAFEATARLGSASAAAQALNITHGAVSRQLKALESELDTQLFIRRGRRLELTAQGETFAYACSDAFERLREARRALERSRARAPFALACPGSLLARWLIPRLDRLNQALPELRLQVVSSEHGLEPLGDGVDASLLFASPPWPFETEARVLAPEWIGPVLAPAGAERIGIAAGQRAPLERLLDQPLLHTASRPQAWPQWAAAVGLDAGRLTLGQGFEHLYYLLEAAEAGLGIAIAPRLLIEEALIQKRLLAPWGFVATGASLALFQRRDASAAEHRRTSALGDWLEAALGENGSPAKDCNQR
ncbi:LysR family transcriptional regulator [Halotalea alkalilenta]|nr:LysR family transcriptional regulator [Halotalea alkalilenta]